MYSTKQLPTPPRSTADDWKGRRVADAGGSFSESAWDAYLIKELGGREPGEFFLAPLVCNGRVAAVLYGDNLPEAKPLPALTGLEIFLHQAGLAMEKALLERRLTELEGEKAKGC